MWMDDDFQFELPNWIIQGNWTTAFILRRPKLPKLSPHSLTVVGALEQINKSSLF